MSNIKTKIKEFFASFEGKKLKPEAEEVLGTMALMMFMLTICINDFSLNIPTIVFLAVWAGTLLCIVKVLQKFGRYYLK